MEYPNKKKDDKEDNERFIDNQEVEVSIQTEEDSLFRVYCIYLRRPWFAPKSIQNIYVFI